MTSKQKTFSERVLTCAKRSRRRVADPSRWTKGRFRRKRPEGGQCYCMVGAVRVSTAPQGVKWAVVEALGAALPPSRTWGTNVVEFNDAPETTHEEMLEVFDKAIERLEKIAHG